MPNMHLLQHMSASQYLQENEYGADLLAVHQVGRQVLRHLARADLGQPSVGPVLGHVAAHHRQHACACLAAMDVHQLTACARATCTHPSCMPVFTAIRCHVHAQVQHAGSLLMACLAKSMRGLSHCRGVQRHERKLSLKSKKLLRASHTM